MSTEAQLHDLSIWLLPEEPAADHNPAALYLAGRAPRSRDGARRALETIATLLTAGQGTADRLAWHLLREDQVAAIRAALTDRHSANEANRMLAALRGVLKHCRRLGLISEDAYRSAHAAATGGYHVSRGELRSVFESCAEDRAYSAERAGAVRTLLYGNGGRESQATAQGQTEAQGQAMTKVDQPIGLPLSVSRNAMSMVQLHLRRAAPREAIAHALWEAGVCLRSSAFCACLAMLRKALDLWSLDYRARHGGRDDDAAGWGDLATRLTKIGGENKLYRDTILTILDALSHDESGGGAGADPSAAGTFSPAGLAAYGGIVCRGGYASSHDGYAISRIKETYRNLHEQVITLITATTPELPL